MWILPDTLTNVLIINPNTRLYKAFSQPLSHFIESEIQINGNTILSRVKAVMLPLPALLAHSLLGHDF